MDKFQNEFKYENFENLENKIIQKYWNDEGFKEELLSDPSKALKDEFGINIPNLKLRIVELEKNEILISIPPNNIYETELSENELDNLSGGTQDILSRTIVLPQTCNHVCLTALCNTNGAECQFILNWLKNN